MVLPQLLAKSARTVQSSEMKALANWRLRIPSSVWAELSGILTIRTEKRGGGVNMALFWSVHQ